MFFFFLGLVFINVFLCTGNYLFVIFLLFDIFFLAKKCQQRLVLIVVAGLLVFYTININYYKFYTSERNVSGEFEVAEKKENYSIVTDGEGKVVEFKELGEKKLAYPVKKELNGYYFVMQIEIGKDGLAELDRKAGLDENVLRHLIIKLDEE